MSMFDMRCEEEAILQPHSQSRHEHLHNEYNKLREEEDDEWQDVSHKGERKGRNQETWQRRVLTLPRPLLTFEHLT